MRLTENLLQFHDSRVGADAMDALSLNLPLLEHLAVGSTIIVMVGHCCVREGESVEESV